MPHRPALLYGSGMNRSGPPAWVHHGRGRGPWRGPAGRFGPPFLVLPVVTGLIQVLAASGAARRHGATLPTAALVLLLAGPAALLLRRRWRPVALVVAVAATTAYFTLGYPDGPAFLAALVAVLGALQAGRRILTWVVVWAGFLTYAGMGLIFDWAAHPSPARLITVGAWLLVTLALGEAARVRSAQFAEVMRARADRERAEAEHRRRQASEERLRIARELHDVLGHHLSLINVQAGVGLHLMDERPEQARAALTAIKQASSEALREVRAVLAALRPEDESPPRSPAPGLDGVPALVGEVRAAGLPVDVTINGSPRAVPAEVDRAAYRIVQEALTNVRRHAGDGATATVRVEYGPQELVVSVTDDGSPMPSDGSDSGSGIGGMRQRVETLGGSFRAEPLTPLGFAVVARLPLGGRS
jgi:signal transduction histidine kinase